MFLIVCGYEWMDGWMDSPGMTMHVSGFLCDKREQEIASEITIEGGKSRKYLNHWLGQRTRNQKTMRTICTRPHTQTKYIVPSSRNNNTQIHTIHTKNVFSLPVPSQYRFSSPVALPDGGTFIYPGHGRKINKQSCTLVNSHACMHSIFASCLVGTAFEYHGIYAGSVVTTFSFFLFAAVAVYTGYAASKSG